MYIARSASRRREKERNLRRFSQHGAPSAARWRPRGAVVLFFADNNNARRVGIREITNLYVPSRWNTKVSRFIWNVIVSETWKSFESRDNLWHFGTKKNDFCLQQINVTHVCVFTPKRKQVDCFLRKRILSITFYTILIFLSILFLGKISFGTTLNDSFSQQYRARELNEQTHSGRRGFPGTDLSSGPSITISLAPTSADRCSRLRSRGFTKRRSHRCKVAPYLDEDGRGASGLRLVARCGAPYVTVKYVLPRVPSVENGCARRYDGSARM